MKFESGIQSVHNQKFRVICIGEIPASALGLVANYVKDRNSIETWSKAGEEGFVQGTSMNYDFTDSVNKAYGNNIIQIEDSPLMFGVYSGDVNQNGSIDLNDVLQIHNDATNFISGYVVTDVSN